jgi:hypothetical protein
MMSVQARKGGMDMVWAHLAEVAMAHEARAAGARQGGAAGPSSDPLPAPDPLPLKLRAAAAHVSGRVFHRALQG